MRFRDLPVLARAGDLLRRRQPVADLASLGRSRQDRSTRLRIARPALSRGRGLTHLCSRARGRIDPRSRPRTRRREARSPQGAAAGAGASAPARSTLRRQVRLDPRPPPLVERSQARSSGAERIALECASPRVIEGSPPAASRTRSSSPPSLASSPASYGPSLALTPPPAEDHTTQLEPRRTKRTRQTPSSLTGSSGAPPRSGEPSRFRFRAARSRHARA